MERDLIDGVILLPDNLFYNTNAAGIVVVLSKRKPEARKDKIVLVNASRRVGKGRPKNYIPEEDIPSDSDCFPERRAGGGEVAVITQEQAAEADYNLSPSRWVGQVEGIEEADLQDIMERFEAITVEEAFGLS